MTEVFKNKVLQDITYAFSCMEVYERTVFVSKLKDILTYFSPVTLSVNQYETIVNKEATNDKENNQAGSEERQVS